jgi:hypothetical protein
MLNQMPTLQENLFSYKDWRYLDDSWIFPFS